MIKNKIILGMAFSLFSAATLAESDCFDCAKMGDIYISLEAGASFSRSALLDVETNNNSALGWDTSIQGYNDDLGTSEMLGASIGYVINQLAAIEIEVARRNSFEYEKFQTTTSVGGVAKTRHFDLQNTTVMANLYLNGSGLPNPFAFKGDDFVVDPFINAGIGVGFNTVSDFHSIRADGTPSALMQDHTEAGFAYQFGAGLSVRTEKNIGASVGYRYLNGGHFESNDYIENSATSAGGKQIPWEGRLRTNEVYVSLDYYL